MFDNTVETHTERSTLLHLTFRRLSIIVTDSEFFKDRVEFIIQKNKWTSNHSPKPSENPIKDAESEASTKWQRNSKAVDEALQSLLGDVNVSRTYSRMYEQRARIGIAEVSQCSLKTLDSITHPSSTYRALLPLVKRKPKPISKSQKKVPRLLNLREKTLNQCGSCKFSAWSISLYL